MMYKVIDTVGIRMYVGTYNYQLDLEWKVDIIVNLPSHLGIINQTCHS